MKYIQNIVWVDVEVARGMFKGTCTLYIFNPRLLKNPNQNCCKQFLNHCRSYFSFIKDRITKYYSFDFFYKIHFFAPF